MRARSSQILLRGVITPHERLMKRLRRVIDHFEEIVFVGIARRSSFARQRDADTRRDMLDRFRKCEALGEREELEDVAAGSAAETVEESFTAIDGERRRLLAMKWTETFVRLPRLLERRHLRDELDDVGRLPDLRDQ